MRRIQVKPVTNKTELFGWIVLELTPIQSFFDDWRRYGPVIAIKNAIIDLLV